VSRFHVLLGFRVARLARTGGVEHAEEGPFVVRPGSMMAARAQRKKKRVLVRRSPKQERAQGTVDVILQAAACILEVDGAAALTTNAIAARAGVSIGSLYEYFPSKQAVLVALARRQLLGDRASFSRIVREGAGKDIPGRARDAIRALLKLEASEQNVRGVTMPTLIGQGLQRELADPVRAVAEELARTDETVRQLPRQAIFVLTRAVVGTVRAACSEERELLMDPDFEDELVRLVEAFVTAPRPARDDP
jgi:AcrR family transcriptional regulator